MPRGQPLDEVSTCGRGLAPLDHSQPQPGHDLARVRVEPGHLARQELRVALREWHKRIPEYSVKPGHKLVYTPAIRSIDDFPMVFTPRD